MANIRPKDLPAVTSVTIGDKILLDGTTARSILAKEFLNGTCQVITSGDCTVVATDRLIIINKTVGAATAVTLPASASKIGSVKIVDFKGDAGTNNITITPDGTEKFNGAAATWVLSGDGASVVLDPIPTGLGYGV